MASPVASPNSGPGHPRQPANAGPMRPRVWEGTNGLAFLTGTGGYIGQSRGGSSINQTTNMNSQDTRTLAERLFADSFNSFMEDLPATYKRGTVMKCCLESFKKKLDRAAAEEMNAFKISYDAACMLLHQKDCDIDDLNAMVNRMEAKTAKQRQLIINLRQQIEDENKRNPEKEWIWNLVNTIEQHNQILEDVAEQRKERADRLEQENQQLKKKLQEYEESATKLKEKKKKEFQVLFPALKFD